MSCNWRMFAVCLGVLLVLLLYYQDKNRIYCPYWFWKLKLRKICKDLVRVSGSSLLILARSVLLHQLINSIRPITTELTELIRLTSTRNSRLWMNLTNADPQQCPNYNERRSGNHHKRKACNSVNKKNSRPTCSCFCEWTQLCIFVIYLEEKETSTISERSLNSSPRHLIWYICIAQWRYYTFI